MFSGIGGFELGIKQAYEDLRSIQQTISKGSTEQYNFEDKLCEWECVGYSEIDKYAIQIYEKHFKGVKNYGDATKIKADELPDFDFLCGGFPCQAFSGAGQRKGFNDTRGTLFFDIARIVKEKRPKYFLLENVSGLLSHDKGRTFKTILSTLDELGYECEWMVFDSWAFGSAPRKRVYIRGTDRKQNIHAMQGIKQTISTYANLCERIVNENKTTRNKELGRGSGRIIRTFARLPDWLHDWDTLYETETSTRKCSNS